MVGPMDSSRDIPRDGLVTFLPHRLNRHPVVVRGLTADELWVCAGLSAAAGFVAGVPLAWLTHSIAMVPTLIVVGIGIGVFVGGGLLRRYKAISQTEPTGTRMPAASSTRPVTRSRRPTDSSGWRTAA